MRLGQHLPPGKSLERPANSVISIPRPDDHISSDLPRAALLPHHHRHPERLRVPGSPLLLLHHHCDLPPHQRAQGTGASGVCPTDFGFPEEQELFPVWESSWVRCLEVTTTLLKTSTFWEVGDLFESFVSTCNFYSFE